MAVLLALRWVLPMGKGEGRERMGDLVIRMIRRDIEHS